MPFYGVHSALHYSRSMTEVVDFSIREGCISHRDTKRMWEPIVETCSRCLSTAIAIETFYRKSRLETLFPY